MYAIGDHQWSLVCIRMRTIYGEHGLSQEVDEVIFNIHHGNCTIFSDKEEAKRVLDQIKTGHNITFTNDSILDLLLEGNTLDTSKLKLYELVPTEVMCEEDYDGEF